MPYRYTDAFKEAVLTAFPLYTGLHKKLERDDFSDNARVALIGTIKTAASRPYPVYEALNLINEGNLGALKAQAAAYMAKQAVVQMWERGGATEEIPALTAT